MHVSKVLSCGQLGLAALVAMGVAGCNGGGGGGAAVAPPPPPPGVVTPVVANTVPGNSTAANPAQAFKLIDAQGASVVTVNSPPVVKFTIIDSDGNPVAGLGLMDKTPGANLDNCGTGTGALRYARNVRAAIAKLVPGSNGAPDQWQSLIYATSTSAGNGGSAADPLIRATTDPTPSTTNNAPTSSMTYANGVYTYTFSTDVVSPTYNSGPINTDGSANPNQWTSTLDNTGATVPAAPASGGVMTNGKVLTKDGTTTYRVALQMCYMDKGKRVYANPTYDFTVAADGNSAPVTNPAKTRQMVDEKSCNECHNQLAVHGGSRIDTDYCVICHNESTEDKTPLLNGAVNQSVDLKYMVHKIHMGKHLFNGFRVGGPTHDFSEVGFPQDVRNCTKCHDGSNGAAHQTPQGNNWMNVPSRNACGACHDGINFATGGGKTLDPDTAWANLGHVGGAQADDSKCTLCHSPAGIQVNHIPVAAVNNATATMTTYYASDENNLPAGAIKVSYDISSVSRDANKHPVMVFRLLQNGVKADFNVFGPGVTELWNNFTGSVSAYFGFAVPQDGVAAPADFNASVSGSIKNIWNGSATGTSAGTLTGPDANGYYTVTLTGVVVPDSAVMLTGHLGYGAMIQTNVPGYVTGSLVGATAKTKVGLNVPGQDVKKVATGYTGRRAITDTAKCNLCHEKLGVFTDSIFHSGQRNDPTSCALCHNPNRTSSGWSADSINFVHGVHGKGKRAVTFNWHATATDLFTYNFPGNLADCKTCHVDGSYDFSAPASNSAVGNRLFRTAATGVMSTTAVSISPYVTVDGVTNYGTGFSYNAGTDVTTPAAGTTLVSSPIATACFACHDGDMASSPGTAVKDHIEQMGIGSIYQPRATALGKSEQCLLCHGATSTIAPIKAAHGL